MTAIHRRSLATDLGTARRLKWRARMNLMCRLSFFDNRPGLHMIRILSGIVLFLSASLAPAICNAAVPDRASIADVIQSFRTAIIQRDKPRFLGLFITPDLPWQSVVSDKSLVEMRSVDPKKDKLRFNPKNNPTSFIDFVVTSKATSEETFSNVAIDGDGDVATVTFDYTFLADGRATNSGKECWLLVRSETGWTIMTLAWSVELAQEHPRQ